jgi:hypothetical protein
VSVPREYAGQLRPDSRGGPGDHSHWPQIAHCQSRSSCDRPPDLQRPIEIVRV